MTNFIQWKIALRHLRFFHLRFHIDKHIPLALQYCCFLKTYHQAVKWHFTLILSSSILLLISLAHSTFSGSSTIVNFTDFFHRTHSVMVIFVDFIYFRWSSINSIIYGSAGLTGTSMCAFVKPGFTNLL